MLLGRDVAKHGRAEPDDHRGADGRGDVVVAGRDVGRQRAERVEGRLVADGELPVHVLLDQVHRDMTRALDHHLGVVLPRDSSQFTEGIEFSELSFIIRVRLTTRTQASPSENATSYSAMISQISRKWV